MEALGAIGTALSGAASKMGGLGTIIPGALTGFGFINNLLNQQKRNRIYNLETNPQAMARFVQGETRPLAAGAVAGAENEAQAAIGERGLSQSPAQAASIYAQALAPLYARQQDLATQLAATTLGNAGSVIAPPTDVSGPLADLMKALQQRQGTTTAQQAAATQTNVGAIPDVGIGSTGTPDFVWQPPTAPDIFGLPSGSIQAPDWASILGGVSAMPTDLSSILSVPGGFGGPA